MSTHAAALPRREPRRTARERVATGGDWWRKHVWRSCIHYVKRSNAWPGPTPEGHPWQNRPPGPEGDGEKQTDIEQYIAGRISAARYLRRKRREVRRALRRDRVKGRT